MARILKARYFPNYTFLKASKESWASWGWSSLLEGLTILKNGCCWKIGNGKLVKIYEDKWILELHGNSLNTKPLSFDSSVSYVAELIDPSHKKW